jgi:UDP-N-acetylglucosamine 3-dehydrogenase
LKIHVGIIGTGNIASLHIAGFRQHPNVEVVAVCDKIKKKAERKASQWGIKRIFTDYRELLNQSDIDAVAILTPHYLHAPMAIAAAEAGKHILVEKPIATAVDDADHMIQAANKAGVYLMVAENQVFHPPHIEAKRLIDNGEIGIPVMIKMNLGWGTGTLPTNGASFIQALAAFDDRYVKVNPEWDAGDLWRLDQKKRGGGNLIDEGHHRFSVASYLFGPFEHIFAYLDEFRDEKLAFSWEYGGIFGWKYRNKKCYGTLTTHLGGPEFITSEGGSFFDDRIEVVGSKGYLWIRGCEGKIMDSPPLQILTNQGLRNFPNIPSGYAAGFNELTRHFIESLLNDIPPRFTGEDGKKVLDIIASAYESAKQHRLIQIKE